MESHSIHKPLSHSSRSSVMLLWMVLDGVGLATILVCTVFEGYDLWHVVFHTQWSHNQGSILFWFSGRFLQVLGLFSLISHAATFQVFHIFEFTGMALLTIGPILNLFSCSLMHMHNLENAFVFRRKWMIAELLELVGILFLDLSLIDTAPMLVLLAEVIGFFVLGIASLLELIYIDNDLTQAPLLSFKTDSIHVSDCIGLFMLTLVAIGQYRIKVYKSSTSISNTLNNHHTIITTTSHTSKINNGFIPVSQMDRDSVGANHSQDIEVGIGVHGEIVKLERPHQHRN